MLQAEDAWHPVWQLQHDRIFSACFSNLGSFVREVLIDAVTMPVIIRLMAAIQNHAAEPDCHSGGPYEQPPPHSKTGRISICICMGAEHIIPCVVGTLVSGTVHCPADC